MNELKQQQNKIITLHWWNMGKKKLDYEGALKTYLIEKAIKVRTVKHPTVKEVNGYRIRFELSSRVVTMDIFHKNYFDCCIEGIAIFLTILGDKATINIGYKTIYIHH